MPFASSKYADLFPFNVLDGAADCGGCSAMRCHTINRPHRLDNFIIFVQINFVRKLRSQIKFMKSASPQSFQT